MKHFISTLAVLFLCAALPACIDDSNADAAAGPTDAEFAALKDRVTELEALVAEIAARSPGDRVVAGNATTGTGKMQMLNGKLEMAPVDLGTLLGYVPSDVPAFVSEKFSLKSPNGFLYALPNNRSNDGEVHVSELNAENRFLPLYFESPDCSGQGYAHADAISDYGAQQGTVFRVRQMTFSENEGLHYIPSGSTETAITTQSAFWGGDCYVVGNFDFTDNGFEAATAGYAAIPNDPTITGVENAPIPTPVQLSN